MNALHERFTSFIRNLNTLYQEAINYSSMGAGVTSLILSAVLAQDDSVSPIICMTSAFSLIALMIAFYVSVDVLLHRG